MLKIVVHNQALQPMLSWLEKAKTENLRDENRLREILRMEDYSIEFARYGMEGLPVCGISFEEAVDFFLNFDRKDFDNQRLQVKKNSFLPFYENMGDAVSGLGLFTDFTREDICQIERLLQNGLPEKLLEHTLEIHILLVISIGNSFGWPYKNYIDFDAANLEELHSKEELLHLIAHEIHHMFFGSLVPEEMQPEEYFLLNFAFEGLAVHFANNQPALYKPAKYPGGSFCMADADMALYESEFDELFYQLRENLEKTRSMTIEQVAQLISREYEQFSYRSLKTGEIHQISQYPTYYLGCYLFGIIDYAFGKERLFEALAKPDTLIDRYNAAVRKVGDPKYLLPG